MIQFRDAVVVVVLLLLLFRVVFDDVHGVVWYPTSGLPVEKFQDLIYSNSNRFLMILVLIWHVHQFKQKIKLQVQRTCVAPPGGPSARAPVAVDLGEALRRWIPGLCLKL